MRDRAPSRPREEYLLLLIAAFAFGTAVVPVARDLPTRPAVWAATAVALGLSFATAFTFWLAGAARGSIWQEGRREDDVLRSVVAAVPDGLLVLDGDRIVAANRVFCELLGYELGGLAGAQMPFPFWPPEHRHEIEAWHAALPALGGRARRLLFAHRSGERVPVLLAAHELRGDLRRAGRYVVSVREVSESYRRERRLSKLSSRDPETALLDERGFEASLRAAVRRARADGKDVSVAILALQSEAQSFTGGLGAPEALLVIERLQAALRAGEELGRTGDDEIALILPDTDAAAAVEAVGRARRELAGLGATLTAGVCDLATAADVPSLYALADQALEEARRQGAGTTATYADLRAAAAHAPARA